MFIKEIPIESADWPQKKQIYRCEEHGMFIVEDCYIIHEKYGADTVAPEWNCPTCERECRKVRRTPKIKKYPSFDTARDENLHPDLEGIPLGEVPGDEDYYDLDNPLAPKP